MKRHSPAQGSREQGSQLGTASIAVIAPMVRGRIVAFSGPDLVAIPTVHVTTGPV